MFAIFDAVCHPKLSDRHNTFLRIALDPTTRQIEGIELS